jgi:hypothetical protein
VTLIIDIINLTIKTVIYNTFLSENNIKKLRVKPEGASSFCPQASSAYLRRKGKNHFWHLR